MGAMMRQCSKLGTAVDGEEYRCGSDGLSLCSSDPVGIFHGSPILLFAGLHACRIRCSVAPVSTAQFLRWPNLRNTGATWCICKVGMSDSELQKTLDYACGNGADCNPIHQNGPCYNPNTVRAHCNYAVNSFFQKKGQAAGTCDFSSTASITTTDPSITGCAFPSSASGSTTPVSTTPTTTPSTTTGNASPNPIITTPTTGGGAIGGGFNNGLGPSGGVGTYNDMSHARNNNAIFPSITLLLISALAPLMWLQQEH